MGIRTQIYLPEDLYQRLRMRSKATGKSMAEQIRESLERYLTDSEAENPKPDDPIWEMAGQAKSNYHDLSDQHNHYLYGRPLRPAKNPEEGQQR